VSAAERPSHPIRTAATRACAIASASMLVGCGWMASAGNLVGDAIPGVASMHAPEVAETASNEPSTTPSEAQEVAVTAAKNLPPATRVEDVTIEPGADATRVVVQLDGFADPEVSLWANRLLILDLPGAACAAEQDEIEIETETEDAVLERVRTCASAQPDRETRLVLELRRRVDFTIRSEGDRVIVGLANAADAAPETTSPPVPEEVALAVPAQKAEAVMPKVVHASSGTGRTSPKTSRARSRTAAKRELAAATFGLRPAPTASAPTSTEPSLATATEASTIAPSSPAEATQALAALGGAEGTVTPGSAVLPVIARSIPAPEEVAPVPEEPSPAPANEARDKRVSVDFANTDVRTVIDLLASAGGYRAIFTPDVVGRVSVQVFERPWEEALARVLRTKRLREVRHDDLMLVTTN